MTKKEFWNDYDKAIINKLPTCFNCCLCPLNIKVDNLRLCFTMSQKEIGIELEKERRIFRNLEQW